MSEFDLAELEETLDLDDELLEMEQVMQSIDFSQYDPMDAQSLVESWDALRDAHDSIGSQLLSLGSAAAGKVGNLIGDV